MKTYERMEVELHSTSALDRGEQQVRNLWFPLQCWRRFKFVCDAVSIGK
jgi:hypothetical protein